MLSLLLSLALAAGPVVDPDLLAPSPMAARPPCSDEATGRLVLVSAPTGTALRDQVQSARAQLVRVNELAKAPTIEPLASEILAERLKELTERTEVHERGLLEMSAWHQRWVEPWERRCKAELTALAANPDPPTPADPPPAEPPRPAPAP